MSSPYSGKAKRAFWNSGVAETSPLDMADIYKRKFKIRKRHAIATAGSCFAQHIARNIAKRGFNVLQKEPAPTGMNAASAQARSFGIYSCRYGNIYTAAQLLQLAQEAFENHTPAEPIWEKDGRYFDAQRPSIEPDGFATPQDVLTARQFHLKNVRQMFLEMDVFVFTFGLTEAWRHAETGTVYPTAPGTIAGQYDAETYVFHNYTFQETIKAFQDFLTLIQRYRDKKLRVITSVSPVPLTATATTDHVLTASTYSKSVLRAVCGELVQKYRLIDYYPSYELITAPSARGIFYERNMRSVSAKGVENAIGVFLQEHDPQSTIVQTAAKAQNSDDPDALICEEVLLEAFNR